VLWPLGGVAYVNPPQRPGATLWSIAAGPLVNVVLAPIIMGIGRVSLLWGWYAAVPDLRTLIHAIFYIDVGLLIFNILPIYPLDGGQILRALLWFVLGRARSLMVATILGFVGIAAFFGFALWARDSWLGVIAVFMLMNCWSGLQHARNAICNDQVSRLRRHLSDEPVVRQRNPRELEASGCHNLASRLTCHFGLAFDSG